MIDKRSAQLIVRVVKRELDNAIESHIRAVANRSAKIAAANAWDDHHPEDGIGGLSQNPYNLDNIDKAELDSRHYLDSVKTAYAYAVETFLEGCDTPSRT